jgi:hypothetical protein
MVECLLAQVSSYSSRFYFSTVASYKPTSLSHIRYKLHSQQYYSFPFSFCLFGAAFAATFSRRDYCLMEHIKGSLFCFVLFCSPSLFYLLVHSRCRGFEFSPDHTQAYTTLGRTPLDEGSAHRRDLYQTTQTLYKTNIHAPGGIRNHDPSKRSVAVLRRAATGIGIKGSTWLKREQFNFLTQYLQIISPAIYVLPYW